MGRRLLLPDPCMADGRQQIKRHYAGKGNNMMNGLTSNAIRVGMKLLIP